ncbi:unnamed protein product [Camellia sinensis]
MENLSFHVCVSILLASIVIVPTESLRPQNRPALFVFGDSLFDSGNNQYINGIKPTAPDYYPYGETFFKHPTGRVSDGRVVPDFIALFAKLPMLGPYLEPGEHNFTDGINFASAGSTVLGDLQPAMPINLHEQLNYFKNVEKWLKQKLGDVEAKKFLMRAVYLFSMGGNDYFRLYSMNPNATLSYQRHYSQMVIGNLTQVLEEIYAMGGRKIAFQNVGPLGCTPGAKPQNANLGGSCAEFPMALARRHNRMLLVVLKKLESQLPGFKYSIFDYYNALHDRIINPSKYGFKEGEAACCGIGTYRSSGCGGNNGTTEYELCSNPFEYVWFDSAHTTEGANWQLAKLLWGGSPKVTGVVFKATKLEPYLEPGEHNFSDGINFASAGSTVLGCDSALNGEKWLKQKLGDAEAKNLMKIAVYLFSMGGNDYFQVSSSNPIATLFYQRHYFQMVIGNLKQVLKRKFMRWEEGKLHFRKQGLWAAHREQDCRISLGTRTTTQQNVVDCPQGNSASCQDSNICYLITTTCFATELSTHQNKGFTEGKALCCGTGTYRSNGCGGNNGTTQYELCSNPFEYGWFDSAHITEGTNLQLAKLLWSGSPMVTGPYNMKQLFDLL